MVGSIPPSDSVKETAQPLEVAHMPRAESTQEDFSDHIDGDEEAEGYEYDSDSDLEDGDDEDVKYSVKKGLQKVHHMTHLLRSRHASHWSDKPCGKGRVIKIHDVAFITYASSNPHQHGAYNDFSGFRPS